MKVMLNGAPRELDGSLNVATLLEELELGATLVAIEINRAVVPRDRWTETPIQDGDVIEIVHFVGGG